MDDQTQYVTVCALFKRDGTAKARVLHRGSREDCERAQDFVPAVVVDPKDDVIEAQTFVWPADKWAAFERRLQPSAEADHE